MESQYGKIIPRYANWNRRRRLTRHVVEVSHEGKLSIAANMPEDWIRRRSGSVPPDA